MARPRKAVIVPEELAQARSIRQIVNYLIYSQEQRDRQIADQLARLDRKLDQLAALLEQYSGQVDRESLEQYGCIVQTNEVLRRLRDDVRAAPAAVVVALAQRAVDLDDGDRPIEVGAGGERDPRRQPRSG